MRAGRWIALALVLAGAAAWVYRRASILDDVKSQPAHIRSDARAPSGVRVRVEVLNASTVRGLARRATMQLRDRGFDVVESGSSSERRDSTLVIDRTGHPAWATLAAKAMGGAAVAARPDSSRDVDLTVLIGATWRPPPEPFYP